MEPINQDKALFAALASTSKNAIGQKLASEENKETQKRLRIDDRQRSGHLQMQVSAEINKHKVSIDKAVFRKLPFERHNINRLKSQYKHDIKHSKRFHEDRNALLDHFMKQQMPNWGMLTFSLVV